MRRAQVAGAANTLPMRARVQGEHADGHVLVLHRGRHVTGRRHLLGSELTRNGAGATAAVVEAASLFQSKPRVVAGGGEAEHSQRHGERNAPLGSFDGGQDAGLGFAGRYPLRVEAEAKPPDQHEEEAHNAEQELDPALKLQDPGAELLLVLSEQLRRDHRSRTPANPAGGGGAGDPKLGEQGRITLLADEVANAVIICSVEGTVRHRAWVDRR